MRVSTMNIISEITSSFFICYIHQILPYWCDQIKDAEIDGPNNMRAVVTTF
jgi:hypothetical protein